MLDSFVVSKMFFKDLLSMIFHRLPLGILVRRMRDKRRMGVAVTGLR